MDFKDSNVNWKWSFWYLVGTTIVFIVLQMAKSSMQAAGDGDAEGLASVIGLLTDVLPIAASGILCRYYWQEMEKDIQRKQLGDSIYPSLMVAQGTFYTFVGISIVLFTFDGNDVANIISGTKLAFFTSVIGLLSSLVAKIYLKRITEEYGVSSSEEYQYYDEADFFNMMKTIDASINRQNNIIERSLNKRLDIVTKGLTKMVEDVTAEQLKKTQECYSSMQKASDKINNDLVANVNKYLSSIDNSVNSIQSFSTDFNAQLRDMRKGFTKLNEALGKVSKQSENFTTQISTNFAQLDNTLVSFLGNTSDKFENLSTTVNTLSETLANMDFTNVKTSVEKAFAPLVEQAGRYNEDMKDVVEQVRTMTQSSRDVMDSFKNSLNDLQTQQTEYKNIFKEYTEVTAMQIAKTNEIVNDNLKKVQGSLERLSVAFNTATKSIQDSNITNVDGLKQYYENMEKYTHAAAEMADNMDRITTKTQQQIAQHQNVLETFNEVAKQAYSNVMDSGKHQNITELLNGLNRAYDNIRMVCDSLQESQNCLTHGLNAIMDKLTELTGPSEFAEHKLKEDMHLHNLGELPDFVDDEEDYDVQPPADDAENEAEASSGNPSLWAKYYRNDEKDADSKEAK